MALMIRKNGLFDKKKSIQRFLLFSLLFCIHFYDSNLSIFCFKIFLVLQLHLLNKIFHLCFLIRMVEAEKFRHSEMKFYDQQKLFEMKSYDPRKVFHSSVNRLWLKPVWLEPKPIFQTHFFYFFITS